MLELTCQVFTVKNLWKILPKLFFKDYVRLMLSLLLLLSLVLFYFLTAWIILLGHYSSQLVPTTLDTQELMMNQKLQNLTRAMSEHEGWSPIANPSAKAGGPSVAYRNHNPGNLRNSIFQLGVRDGFSVFFNDATGFFAMQYDIMMKCQGKTRTGLTGESSLADLIKTWSASEGEALQNYIFFVCQRTGFTPEMKIKKILE